MNEKIVFMGTPSFAANVLEGLISKGFNIIGVVTQPDKEIGRKRVLTPSEVKIIAQKYNIPVLTPTKIRKEYQDVLNLEPDLVITCAYGQFIPNEILDYPKFKCINTHGSLLPLYRGGAPIQRAIINGETETGITIQYMAEKMDEGDILFQKKTNIDIEDTNTTLFKKLSDLALEMLLEFLPKLFIGDINPVCQNNEDATYAPNLPKEIEKIEFNENTINVYNHIRGLLDNPGCYFVLDDKKYKIEKAFFELNDCVETNTFVGLENDYIRIDCKDGFIKVFNIKPEGKNSMDAKSFFNGAGRSLVGKKIG